MWRTRAASGRHSHRSHTVGFIGLGLAVMLTFVLLWAVFFRGAASDVAPQGGEGAAAISPGPSPAQGKNDATEAAPTQPAAAQGSPVRTSPKGPPARHASVGNGTTTQELSKIDQPSTPPVADPKGAPATGTLSPASAETQYEAIEGDYAAASSGVGSLTSDTRPAQLHAAVVQAAAAYEVWISQLQSTSWPPEIQPYVDEYLDLATTKGRALFERALHADSVEDLQDAQAINDMFELSHALEKMRAAMGASD